MRLFDPARLTALANKRGRDMRALARETGVRVDLLGRYVDGETHPSRESLNLIADVLGVEITELLRDLSSTPGEAIAELRELHGLSQSGLAARIRGLTLRELQRIEALEAPITEAEYRRLNKVLAIGSLSIPTPRHLR